MLQRLPIALTQVAHMKVYKMKSEKPDVLSIEKKKSLKMCISIQWIR